MSLPTTPQIDDEFLIEFKRQTEARWAVKEINHRVYGFQFQRGTRWNHGLLESEIEAYENDLGVKFPHDFKRMLRVMNGTDRLTLNVYGSSGEPPSTLVGVYSYSRDLSMVQELMQHVSKDRSAIEVKLLAQGFELEQGARLVPIYNHRYLVCGSELEKSVVLSIAGTDVTVFGDSLKTYLQMEILGS